ncbi:MAG: cytochrome P450 [Catenulispora sp.]|nr:cytochrome P450 [Catenulispora sp.]
MTTATHRASARISTDRAGRYLDQLCRHIQQIGALGGHSMNHGGAAPAAPRVEFTGTDALVDFGTARCVLRATPEALNVAVEADDAEALSRVRQSVTHRLETIGRRDRLMIDWGEQGAGTSDAATLLALLLEPAGRADPWPLYARLHRLGPVQAIGDDLVLVSGYAAVNQVLRDPAFGMPGTDEQASAATAETTNEQPSAPAAETPAEQPSTSTPETPDGQPTSPTTDASAALHSLSRSILRADPPDHGRMRSLISQVFTPRRIATLRPAVERAVDELLDRSAALGAGGRPVDFMDAFAFPLPVTVICELLGVPDAGRARFRPLAADLTEALELTDSLSQAAEAAARELAEVFAALIAERRASPADDLIGALVAARDADDGSLSDSELLANLILLLVAGFETTTGLLGAGVAELLADPGLLTALRSGHVAVTGFIEEVLRIESPVQVTTRVARRDGLTIAGTPVPRGAQVILLIGAANRDPARYPEPDRFDPRRTDVKPLSFGAGAHVCLGNALARIEAEIAFARLAARFPGLAADPDASPTRRDRLVLRGYETLPIIVGGSDRGAETDRPE